MNFQLMLSEPRSTRGAQYDHVTDIVESDGPEVLLDVVYGSWRLENVLTGGRKLALCTIIDVQGECIATERMDVNFYDGQLCVMTKSVSIELVEWCEAQRRTTLKDAEDHNLGSE